MNLEEMKFRSEMARERWGERWYDFRSFFVHRWWRFQEWRRKRNPELMELDTFRRIVELEDKLKRYPTAVPLLTEAMNAYHATGQEEKRIDVMRRLRDIDLPEPAEPESDDAASIDYGIEESLYEKALALVRGGVKAKAAVLNRKLGVGYNDAARICDMLIDRGVVDVETRESIS